MHVLNEQSEHRELNTSVIVSSMDKWWANCLRSDSEREWIGELIKKVRAGRIVVEEDGGESVFSRELYRRALLNRQRSGALGLSI